MSAPLCLCPGRYCGCVAATSVNISSLDFSSRDVSPFCGKCPRGSRVNPGSGYCETCSEDPTLYDWLYLSSMLVILFFCHVVVIDWTLRKKFTLHLQSLKDDGNKETNKKQCCLIILLSKIFSPKTKFHCAVILFSCVAVELSLSVMATLLITHPFGQMSFKTCGSSSIADWYPIFFNAKINFTTTLYCTQEVVYPLYSIVLLFFCCDLLLVLLIRPVVTWNMAACRGVDMASYIALYFIPLLVFIHAIGAGILYYSFPYLFLILSVVSVAFNLCIEYSRCSSSILKMCAPPPPRLVAMVILHWGLHIFAIISVARNESLAHIGKLIILTPLPTLFFFFTVRFTDPAHILHRNLASRSSRSSAVGHRLGVMPPSSTSLHSVTSSASSAPLRRARPMCRVREQRHFSVSDRFYCSGASYTLGPTPAANSSNRRRNQSTNQAPTFLSVVLEQHQTQMPSSSADSPPIATDESNPVTQSTNSVFPRPF